jgi:hypothetical protein
MIVLLLSLIQFEESQPIAILKKFSDFRSLFIVVWRAPLERIRLAIIREV